MPLALYTLLDIKLSELESTLDSATPKNISPEEQMEDLLTLISQVRENLQIILKNLGKNN